MCHVTSSVDAMWLLEEAVHSRKYVSFYQRLSLPPSKLIKYSIQQIQSALVDPLWSAHPPHDEIIMCDYETLRHETKNGNYFLEETTGRSGTLPPQIFSPQIYILHNNRVWLVKTSASLSTTVRHDETSASSLF